MSDLPAPTWSAASARVTNNRTELWWLATATSVFSARQHICYSALYAIARPSVRPSVRHTGGSVKDG